MLIFNILCIYKKTKSIHFFKPWEDWQHWEEAFICFYKFGEDFYLVQ